jgi:hypothetical protein
MMLMMIGTPWFLPRMQAVVLSKNGWGTTRAFGSSLDFQEVSKNTRQWLKEIEVHFQACSVMKSISLNILTFIDRYLSKKIKK